MNKIKQWYKKFKYTIRGAFGIFLILTSQFILSSTTQEIIQAISIVLYIDGLLILFSLSNKLDKIKKSNSLKIKDVQKINNDTFNIIVKKKEKKNE
ncbi:MAG: hypothetical protein K9K32_00140 [Halanaerobiales bacterium]|nr:hypothetical protein [Halanaerobiales bacterium]